MPKDKKPSSKRKKIVLSKGSPVVKTTSSVAKGVGEEKVEAESSGSEDSEGIIRGAYGDSMGPAPADDNGIDYGKGINIPSTPSGLV